MVSRRRFLQDGVLVAAACVAAPAAGLGPGPVRSKAPAKKGPPAASNPPATAQFTGLENMDRQQFVDALGTAFQVSSSSSSFAPVWLRLLAVNDFPAPPPLNPASMAVMPKASAPAPVTVTFALSFAGTGTEPLAQGTYTFDHPQLGRFALFVVPGAGPQQTCVAVVNRLQPTGANGGPVVNIVPALGGSPFPHALPAGGGMTPAGSVQPVTPAGSPAPVSTPGNDRSGFVRGRGLLR